MKEGTKLFIEKSKRFYERFDKVLASIDAPDEQWAYQTFDIPRREVAKIDALVESGVLDFRVAEERRFRIVIPAWRLAYTRVLNSWNTRDKLDELYVRYCETVSGGEWQHPNRKEDISRKEALMVFEEVRLEIAVF
jgi:hypothetical protein